MGNNVYASFPAIPAGASGAQAALDLSVVSPPTGLDDELTFICRGQFTGEIVIEGSLDGVGFDPVAVFRAGGDSGQIVELPPITTSSRVAFLRAFVRGIVTGLGVTVTLGGEQDCDCVTNIPAEQCPILSLSEESQKSQNASAFVVVTEWAVDFAYLVANLGPSISVLVTGIARATLGEPDNFGWQLQIGGTPGNADGVIIAATLAGASVGVAESLEQISNASFATPASGPTLVKLVLASNDGVGNPPQDTTFIRGQTVEFSCPLVA